MGRSAATTAFGRLSAKRNVTNWMISGESDARWNDSDMDQIRRIPASALEYVDTGAVIPA